MSYVKIDIQDLFVPNIANCCNRIYTNQAIEDALSSFANKPITRRLKDGSEEVIGIITNSKDGYLFGELYPTIQLLEYREENGYSIIDKFKLNSVCLENINNTEKW